MFKKAAKKINIAEGSILVSENDKKMNNNIK